MPGGVGHHGEGPIDRRSEQIVLGWQGRIVEVLDEDDRVMVKYDDEMDEALQLLNERFQWLAPRAQTAGANSELQVRALLPHMADTLACQIVTESSIA